MPNESHWAMHRRHWMILSSSMALSCSASGGNAGTLLWAADSATPVQSPPICVFVKPMQELSFIQLADQLGQWPVHGAEVTIRRGGLIDPASAEDQLPRLMDELNRVDRATVILATDVNSADHLDWKRVIEPAVKVGIRYFRMGYLHYDLEQPILRQLDQFAKEFESISKHCQSLGVQGLYQNHAGGRYLGAPLWDMLHVFENVDPLALGLALDIRHSTIEANSAWESSYALLRPWIRSVFVKDATIEQGNAFDVPLGKGIARPLFARIRRDGIPGPMSLQMEHLDHRDHKLLPDRIEAIARDIETLHQWLSHPG